MRNSTSERASKYKRPAYVSPRSYWIDREDGRGMVQVPEREYTEWSGFREIRIVS